MINWVKKNRWEFLIIVCILALAAFLRFYKLSDYMTFLGDEGRDALIIKDLLVNHNIPFIGPPMSVGNIYLGPLYYYMMAISMAIFWLNPVAAAGMIALIGVLSVGLIYYLTREWFGKEAAVVSSLLYTVSFVTNIYSRSSWNPNPVPFFTLLSVLGFYLAYQRKNFYWFILTGASVAAAVQMHYLALILIPIFFVLWFYIFFKEKAVKNFWWGTAGAIIAFLLIISPLILFDIKHNFANYHAIIDLFTKKNEAVGVNSVDRFRIFSIYKDSLISRYVSAENNLLTWVVALGIFILILVMLYSKVKEKKSSLPGFLLGVWLIVGLIFLSLYKGEVYDHYVGFLSPIPFILVGSFFYLAKLNRGFIKYGLIILTILVTVILSVLNLQKNPLTKAPGKQLQRTQEIAKFIISQSDNKPLNFALLSENNYDAAYQFYLDVYGHKPELAAAVQTDQLFVVCEDEICQPINNPKYEIASYGYAKTEWEKEVDGVKVFKLVPNPSGKP